LPAPERNRRLLDLVRTEAASVLGLGAEEVDLQLGLFDMGMDSLMSVELRSRLAKAVGRKLPSTLTFNYPNVNALAGYLGTLLTAETTTTTMASPVESAPAAPTPARVDTDSLSEDELAALLADSLQTLDGP
jgi:acyl carrier protein